METKGAWRKEMKQFEVRREITVTQRTFVTADTEEEAVRFAKHLTHCCWETRDYDEELSNYRIVDE